MFHRDDRPSDHQAITGVTAAAFDSLAISGHTEHFMVRALRASGALMPWIVAEEGERVMGHIAFSPGSISDSTPRRRGLGSVSVLSDLNRRGIGRALVREGLDRLRAPGALGCFGVGEPVCHGRFGFRPLPALVPEGTRRRCPGGCR